MQHVLHERIATIADATRPMRSLRRKAAASARVAIGSADARVRCHTHPPPPRCLEARDRAPSLTAVTGLSPRANESEATYSTFCLADASARRTCHASRPSPAPTSTTLNGGVTE
eukprot:6209553-Pleurochrysis_carterae.AAC.1